MRPRRRVELIVGAACIVLFVAVSLYVRRPDELSRQGVIRWLGSVRDELGIILAAGLTLIMYSFLYRDNPLFKVAENLYVGVALGYGAVITWYLSLKPEIVDPIFRAPSGRALWDALALRTVPILLGFMLVTRISRRFSWPSRYSYALMIGWGAGISIPISVHTFVLKQLEAAVAPLRVSGGGWPMVAGVSGGVLVLVGTVAVLYYFFFSVERGRVGRVVSRIGVLFLMVSFGASFGYTVMGRVSLFVGRAQFLLYDWLKLPRP